MAKKKDKKRKQREMKAAEAAFAQAMWNAGNGMTPMAGQRGLFGKLAAAAPNQQFVLGALLGAAAVYVLGDEQLRGKLMKSGMNLYASILGGIEEMKEQAADLRAELEAEHAGAE